jgi:hypothetical protein
MAGANHEALRQRLRCRISTALKRIASYRSEGVPWPETVPEDYSASWLPLLKPVDRLKFLGYTHVKLPLRRWLNGIKRGRLDSNQG